MNVTEGTVPIDELVTVVKNSVKRAGVSSSDPGSDLRLTSVQLVLRIVASSTIGGGFDIRLPVVGMRLKIGRKITRQDTHTLDMTLRPPKEPPGHELREGDIEDALVNAIDTIREVVVRAAEGDDPWLLAAGSVDISFVITDTGSLSLGVDGELTDEVTHTLRLGLSTRA